MAGYCPTVQVRGKKFETFCTVYKRVESIRSIGISRLQRAAVRVQIEFSIECKSYRKKEVSRLKVHAFTRDVYVGIFIYVGRRKRRECERNRISQHSTERLDVSRILSGKFSREHTLCIRVNKLRFKRNFSRRQPSQFSARSPSWLPTTNVSFLRRINIREARYSVYNTYRIGIARLERSD